jgi:hypothetical protein
MEKISKQFATKADKIRALSKGGYSRVDIAKFLGIRYQHVRNVLTRSTGKNGPIPLGDGSGGAAPVNGIRNRLRLRVDPGGRVLIPAGVREAMNIGDDGAILAWLENGELRLVSPVMASRQAQELARQLIRGDDSLADELIANRREEATRERKNG